MTYEFKLESLRRYRQFEEARTQKQLAEAQRQLESEQARLRKLLDLRAETESAFVQNQECYGIASQAAMYREYLHHLAGEIGHQEKKVENISRRFDACREALSATMKKRKTLDRLKEKGAQAHQAESERKEENLINEMAINRYTMKQR